MLLATASLLARMCSADVYCSKQTGGSSTKTITHHFFVSGIGRRKLSMQPKFVAAQILLKRSQQTFVNGLLGFITLKRCAAGSAWCVLLTIIAWVAYRYGQLCLPAHLCFLGFASSCLHSDQPLSEGEIIPFSGVCQSGKLHYPRRRRWWLHALTDELLWCATDDDKRQHHHAEHHFRL